MLVSRGCLVIPRIIQISLRYILFALRIVTIRMYVCLYDTASFGHYHIAIKVNVKVIVIIPRLSIYVVCPQVKTSCGTNVTRIYMKSLEFTCTFSIYIVRKINKIIGIFLSVKFFFRRYGINLS